MSAVRPRPLLARALATMVGEPVSADVWGRGLADGGMRVLVLRGSAPLALAPGDPEDWKFRVTAPRAVLLEAARCSPCVVRCVLRSGGGH